MKTEIKILKEYPKIHHTIDYVRNNPGVYKHLDIKLNYISIVSIEHDLVLWICDNEITLLEDEIWENTFFVKVSEKINISFENE